MNLQFHCVSLKEDAGFVRPHRSDHAVANVCDHVSAQVAGVVEAGGALVAGVGLLARMSPQVDLQAAVLREALPTLRTRVWFLSGVDAHVDAKRGLVDERLAAQGARNGGLARVACPVNDQVFAAEEALAAEAAIQGFADGVSEGVLLLWERADVTGVAHLAIRPGYSCFNGTIQRRHLSGVISFQLAVSEQPHTVILHCSAWCSVNGGEIHNTVVSDTVVRRQRAKSLQFRGSEEGVRFLLKRPLSSAVDTHYSQLLVIACQAGTSRLCGNTAQSSVVTLT